MTRTHCRAVPPDGRSLADLVRAASDQPSHRVGASAMTELVPVFPHRTHRGVSIERIRKLALAASSTEGTLTGARVAAAPRRKT